jgi:hypothetical protein
MLSAAALELSSSAAVGLLTVHTFVLLQCCIQLGHVCC